MYEVFGGWAILPGGVARDVSIAVEKDRIADIGPTRRMRSAYKFSESVGGKDRIICPGFVDAHLHSFQIATKGLTEGESLLAWLKKYIWKWEAELNAERARVCAEVAYLQLMRCGVTAFADFTSVHHTEEAFRVAEKLGMRALIGKTMMDRASPPGLEEGTDTALRGSERLIRKWDGAAKGRLRYALTPRFEITCSSSLLDGCAGLAGKYGVRIQTHAHENQSEVASDRKACGMSAIKDFRRLGLLGPQTTLAHCIWLDKLELHLLARTGTRVAHCPGSNMLLASGVADTPAMLENGIHVGLGSDVAAYYNVSPFEQMRLACLMQKVARQDPNALMPGAAFNMATLGGAACIGMERESGSLEKGKKADIVLLSTNRLAFSPLNDVLSQVIYSAYPSSVHESIVDGKILMRERKVLVADEKKVMKKAKEVLGKMRR